MGEDRDHRDRVTFRDVLLARRYLGELRDTGKLSTDLQAAVDQRGAEHVERLAQIIANRDVARGHIEQRARDFAERVVSILKAKRGSANSEEVGSVDSGRDPAARKADEGSHE
jgi:hypothetical protein